MRYWRPWRLFLIRLIDVTPSKWGDKVMVLSPERSVSDGS